MQQSPAQRAEVHILRAAAPTVPAPPAQMRRPSAVRRVTRERSRAEAEETQGLPQEVREALAVARDRLGRRGIPAGATV